MKELKIAPFQSRVSSAPLKFVFLLLLLFLNVLFIVYIFFLIYSCYGEVQISKRGKPAKNRWSSRVYRSVGGGWWPVHQLITCDRILLWGGRSQVFSQLSPVREACGFGNISTEEVSCSKDDGCTCTLIFSLRLASGLRGQASSTRFYCVAQGQVVCYMCSFGPGLGQKLVTSPVYCVIAQDVNSYHL